MLQKYIELLKTKSIKFFTQAKVEHSLAKKQKLVDQLQRNIQNKYRKFRGI